MATDGPLVKHLPDFFNRSLVQRILEENLPVRPVHVDEFSGTSATKPGDNYSSDVFTITVRYNGTEEIRLLAKIMANVGMIKDFAESLCLFEKEVETFRQILPTFSELVTPAGASEAIRFGARCYYAASEPTETIVFDDLKTLGYRLPDRTKGGLDFAHCELIMKKIGLFHAASMVYAARGPKELEHLSRRYSHGLVRTGDTFDNNPALAMFTNGLEKFLEVAPGWPELDRGILGKLQALRPVYTQRIVECYTAAASDGYKVLNHGDLWSSNMMFRYGHDDANSDTDVREVMFVDYQICNYGSPGLDLVYCLYNCSRFEVREKRIGELLQIYHCSLADGLKTAGYRGSVPTLADVQREFDRHEFIGLLSGLSMLPVILLPRLDDIVLTFDTFFDKQHADRLRQMQYTGEKYRRSVIPLLDRLNAKGLLK
ncbi:uncharacterized protein LOC128276184 [Anopheles cruzii]|uniref:uncharacterized protein LOC128276181 n=1 Tax=Anopheles cruzii TaxID=68878 RepID=UPI0022EC568C|nr:uncharacterized protein LOC128276181 [Anopheles cruzii]XP_052870611.1 uncharacterized protein LOC128276184 [Anopheles cruzii]